MAENTIMVGIVEFNYRTVLIRCILEEGRSIQTIVAKAELFETMETIRNTINNDLHKGCMFVIG